jgi:hypothetical protein
LLVSNPIIPVSRLLTVSALDEETKKIRAAMTGISDRFKPIIDDGAENLIDLTETEYPEGLSPQDAMHHPYHLCGVATNLDVVYVLHPNPKADTPGAQQWWRVQYDTETSSPTIRRDPISREEVLERAATESAAALLVYAHADATSAAPLPLSKPLEDFVKKDGVNFMEELQKATTAGGWEEYDIANDNPQGTWNADPPEYEGADWSSMSANEFHRHGSNLSSATLTPNTEHGDQGVTEMVEVNGGMDALTGVSSRASSSTIEGDVMEIDGHGTASLTGQDEGAQAGMEEVRGEEPRVRHIEIAEKKGG